MVKPLPLGTSAELNDMAALDPTQVFVEVVVLPVPSAAAGILGIDVNRLHSRANAFPKNTESRVEAVGLCIATCRRWDVGGMHGAPLPPVAQIVKGRLAGQMGS